jgi:hypothetical protein
MKEENDELDLGDGDGDGDGEDLAEEVDGEEIQDADAIAHEIEMEDYLARATNGVTINDEEDVEDEREEKKRRKEQKKRDKEEKEKKLKKKTEDGPPVGAEAVGIRPLDQELPGGAVPEDVPEEERFEPAPSPLPSLKPTQSNIPLPTTPSQPPPPPLSKLEKRRLREKAKKEREQEQPPQQQEVRRYFHSLPLTFDIYRLLL